MKDFSRSQYNFSTIRREQKIIYSIFLGFMLLGIVSILVFYLVRTGLTGASLAEYYLGNEEKMMYPKTFQELWEVTHFHLFTMPVVYLIFAHLFAMTRASGRLKGAILLGAAAGIFLDLLSGWLIVYLGAGFVFFKIAGRWLLAASFPLFVAIPLYEMWFKKHKPHPPAHHRKV